MSSAATRCAHLRLPRRPQLPRLRQSALSRRALVLDRPSAAHVRLEPHSQALHDRIQRAVGHQSRLDAIRAAFVSPGKPHLKPDERPILNHVQHARSAIPLQHHQRRIVLQQLERCGYRADYLNLITAVLVRGAGDPRFKYGACRVICDSLYTQLLNASDHHADPSMLILANQIRYKIEDARVPLPPELVYIGLLCAAACHSVPALKTYLYERRVLDSPMPALVFARLVDGIVQHTHKSFRRPSAWRRPLREEHASAVMLGFPDAPVHEPYDLSSCVPRESWPCMDRWVRALARYKFLPQLRLEWALWLESPLRTSPQSCTVPAKAAGPPTAAIINEDREPMRRLHEAGIWNTRTRGDLAFVEAFRRSGGIEEAWMVLKESDFSFDLLKRRTQTALLAYPELAAPELWTEEMRARMLNSYAAELAKIESVYGAEWVWDEQAGTGYHRISEESFLCSQEEHENPGVSGRGDGS